MQSPQSNSCITGSLPVAPVSRVTSAIRDLLSRGFTHDHLIKAAQPVIVLMPLSENFPTLKARCFCSRSGPLCQCSFAPVSTLFPPLLVFDLHPAQYSALHLVHDIFAALKTLSTFAALPLTTRLCNYLHHLTSRAAPVRLPAQAGGHTAAVFNHSDSLSQSARQTGRCGSGSSVTLQDLKYIRPGGRLQY